jgi:hypothetical protein
MGLCSQIAPVLLAQDSAPAPASAGETRPVQLSPGVPDILKLVSARVSDGTITAFINNSGRTYHLSVSEILYPREQGMSEQVLTAMLTAGQNVAAISAQAAPQPAPQPVQQLALQPTTTGPTADWVNSSPPPAPAPTQYAPAYQAVAPVYTQPAPVYTYPAPYYGYYDSWPYYWGYPSISFGFGFGHGYYGGYHGGYHGGGYHGGGGGGHH